MEQQPWTITVGELKRYFEENRIPDDTVIVFNAKPNISQNQFYTSNCNCSYDSSCRMVNINGGYQS